MAKSFSAKALCFCILLFIDAALNSLIGLSTSLINAILSIVQLVALVVGLFLVFLLMGDTILFGYGLLGILCSQMKPIFVAMPVYITVTIPLRVLTMINGFTGQAPQENWKSDIFTALFYVQGCVALAYYIVALHTLFRLADPKLYNVDEGWIK
ncbi:hypothetical protein PBRA_002093 [Plasmodiophora brassicae]|uniref:Transmembrane protein 138 n=1 Tax=Plasmodiophora brassicae TaxID=37360 RepID=A0A0G4J1T9_PLABS|nr:hypothetical protein PBRA_002093 [Plasmodiophora brassicae]